MVSESNAHPDIERDLSFYPKGWNEHSAVICRGVDLSGHWVHHARPEGEHIPERK